MSDAKEAVAAEVADYARHGSWETLEARLAMRIAAAEERGRRAGIEAHIRDLHAIENALDEFETDPPTALRVVGEHVGMALHNLRDLAPRDSGKDRRWVCTVCGDRHDPEMYCPRSMYPKDCHGFIAIGPYATACGRQLSRPGGESEYPYHCGARAEEHRK